jgi:isopentenyl-diphosphate delta-isomerase
MDCHSECQPGHTKPKVLQRRAPKLALAFNINRMRLLGQRMRLIDSTVRLVETIDGAGSVGPAVGIVEAHRVGAAHRAISIVAWNADRTKMLITRRAATKATWPGFWSNAVCSHPRPQESYAAAARRRLHEELQISGTISPAFRMYYGPVQCPISGAFEHELDHVFYARLPENARIKPNRTEISALRWVNQAQLAVLQQSGKITPWFAMILERVRWSK